MEKSVFCNTHEPMHKQVLAFQEPCFIISLFSAGFIGFLFLFGCLLGFCFFFFFFFFSKKGMSWTCYLCWYTDMKSWPWNAVTASVIRRSLCNSRGEAWSVKIEIMPVALFCLTQSYISMHLCGTYSCNEPELLSAKTYTCKAGLYPF